MSDLCINCRYWEETDFTAMKYQSDTSYEATHPRNRNGQCYRYPTIVDRHGGGWCGEHATKEEGQ